MKTICACLLLALTVWGATTADSELVQNLCQTRNNGFRAIVSGSCSQYYECQNGQTEKHACPLFYDALKGECTDVNTGCVETLAAAVTISAAPARTRMIKSAATIRREQKRLEQQRQEQRRLEQLRLRQLNRLPQRKPQEDVEASSAAAVPAQTTTTSETTTTNPTTTTTNPTTTATNPTTTATNPTTTTISARLQQKLLQQLNRLPQRKPQEDVEASSAAAVPTQSTTTSETTTTNPTTTTTNPTTTATNPTTTTTNPTTTATNPTTTITNPTTTSTTTTISARLQQKLLRQLNRLPQRKPQVQEVVVVSSAGAEPLQATTAAVSTTSTITTTAITTTVNTTTSPATMAATSTTTTSTTATLQEQQRLRQLNRLPQRKPQFVEVASSAVAAPPQSSIALNMLPQCLGKPDNFVLASPRSCSQYYVCHNGVALPVSCGKFHFNASQGTCDLPENSGCIQAELNRRHLY